MEPRIQYAKTSDGVIIAYFSVGQGEPALVDMPVMLDSQLQLGMQDPDGRELAEALAANRQLVRYDSRGSGLSERNVTNFSLEVLMRDLDAVLANLGLREFALIAPVWFGPVAISWEVANPGRVSHLVLWHSWASVREVSEAQARAVGRLLNADWELYIETSARWVEGWSADADRIRRLVDRYREGMTQEVFLAFTRAMRDIDVSDLLSKVQARTLVLQRRKARVSSVDIARNLAARIPGARLLILEGGSSAPYVQGEQFTRAIDEFLGEEGPSSRKIASGMTAILFADIADSTALTERVGDFAFRTKARDLDRSLRTVILDHGGTAIEGKLVGDGVLAVFQSAREAIAAALFCGSAGGAAGLPLHLGVHAGDVIREDNNVYGGAVNIASRISGLSAPGEVLVTETVRSLARTSAGVRFEDRGEQALKGVGEPVRVWAVVATK